MSQVLSTTGNDRIAMGANQPPELILFGEIDAYYDEAKNWADGSEIENDDQLEAVDALDKALLKAGQEADRLRIEAKKPHDDAAQAVQDTFNPYVQKGKGKVDMARAALNVPRTAYKTKRAAEAAAIAAKARAEFEEQQRIAREAMQASSGNLEAREQAEQQATAAKAAEKIMKKAEKAAATGLGLRTSYMVGLADRKLAFQHYLRARPEQFELLIMTLADADVRAGARSIPGINITEVRKAI